MNNANFCTPDIECMQAAFFLYLAAKENHFQYTIFKKI